MKAILFVFVIPYVIFATALGKTREEIVKVCKKIKRVIA